VGFIQDYGDWKRFRELPLSVEVDFHKSERGKRDRFQPYENAMSDVWTEALNAIVDAYEKGLQHVIFTHGSSTSRPGRTTSRSQIRKLMRSTEVTKYVLKSKSIQHSSVFVAVIRQKDRLAA
jgi:hypothetical protein